MLDDAFVIVNPESNKSKYVQSYLDKIKIKYYVCYEKDCLLNMVKTKIKEGFKIFVICGGDGTINFFINSIMKLSYDQRSSIKIGIIPSGRANDLARYMKIPLNIKENLVILNRGNINNIDLIKINNSYMVTGGGIGLPSEIIQDVGKFSRIPMIRHLKTILGDSLYLILTIKKFIFI